MIVKRKSPPLKFFPVQVFIGFALDYHGDTLINGANNLAKIATYTFIFFNSIGVVGFAIGEADGLMRCIFAGYITKTAMNTFILVDVGYMMIIDVEVFPMRNSGNRPANKIIE